MTSTFSNILGENLLISLSRSNLPPNNSFETFDDRTIQDLNTVSLLFKDSPISIGKIEATYQNKNILPHLRVTLRNTNTYSENEINKLLEGGQTLGEKTPYLFNYDIRLEGERDRDNNCTLRFRPINDLIAYERVISLLAYNLKEEHGELAALQYQKKEADFINSMCLLRFLKEETEEPQSNISFEDMTIEELKDFAAEIEDCSTIFKRAITACIGLNSLNNEKAT